MKVRRVISLSLIASSMMFGHTFVFNIYSLENMDIIKEKLDSIKTFIDSNYFDKRALSPLVGGSGDINDTTKDGVGYIIYYPYSEPNLNGYNKLVEECKSDGCEDLLTREDENSSEDDITNDTVECGDGEYYDGSSCQPIPPADNTCENGFYGDPYDGDIDCSNKNLVKLRDGWSELISINGNLNLSFNSLNDLSPLSSLENITGELLDFSNNNLTSIASLSNLVFMCNYSTMNLDLSHNQLSHIDIPILFSENFGYGYCNEYIIDISFNNLTTLDNICLNIGDQNLELLTLDISNNSNLTDISALKCIKNISNNSIIVLDDKEYSEKIPYTPKGLLCGGRSKEFYDEIGGDIFYDYNLNTIDVDKILTNICENIPHTCKYGYSGDPHDGDIICEGIRIEKLGRVWDTLKSVNGSLFIDSDNLTDISNLSNLTYVNRYLDLSDNSLTSLHGLENLTEVGGDFYLNDNNLTDISALSNLTYIENMLNLNTNRLTDITGLENLRFGRGGTLSLDYNNLTSLNGFMDYVDDIIISLDNNPNLTDISALSNLTMIENRLIIENLDIDILDPSKKLSGDTYLCKNVKISNDNNKIFIGDNDYNTYTKICSYGGNCEHGYWGDPYIGDIVCNIDTTEESFALKKVEGDIYIENNPRVNNLVKYLTEVDGSIVVKIDEYSENNNFSMLNNLKHISRDIKIYKDDVDPETGENIVKTPTDINSLNGLTNLGGSIYISLDNSYTYDKLSNNSYLCGNDIINNHFYFYYNSTTPQRAQYIRDQYNIEPKDYICN